MGGWSGRRLFWAYIDGKNFLLVAFEGVERDHSVRQIFAEAFQFALYFGAFNKPSIVGQFVGAALVRKRCRLWRCCFVSGERALEKGLEVPRKSACNSLAGADMRLRIII